MCIIVKNQLSILIINFCCLIFLLNKVLSRLFRILTSEDFRVQRKNIVLAFHVLAVRTVQKIAIAVINRRKNQSR